MSMAIEVNEVVKCLRDAYDKAPEGDKSLGIRLFGIKYADELQNLISHGTSIREIVERAQPLGGSKKGSYPTEVSKGMKLARYVIVRDEGLLWF